VTPANLNRIDIVQMSRADDLVSFVSPRPQSVLFDFQLAQKTEARAAH